MSDDGDPLDSEDQRDIRTAVDAVEAEGESIAEMDPFSERPNGDENDEPPPVPDEGTLEEQVEAYQPDEDYESLDESELQQRLESVTRRNQILEDEVTELRTVLKNTSTDSTQNGHTANSASSDDRTRSVANVTVPSRPVPPNPPVEREGIAGNIVEFVAMVLFLTKAFVYRCRLLWYQLRWGRTGTESA